MIKHADKTARQTLGYVGRNNWRWGVVTTTNKGTNQARNIVMFMSKLHISGVRDLEPHQFCHMEWYIIVKLFSGSIFLNDHNTRLLPTLLLSNIPFQTELLLLYISKLSLKIMGKPIPMVPIPYYNFIIIYISLKMISKNPTHTIFCWWHISHEFLVICERFNPNDPRKKSPKLMFLNSYSRCITSQFIPFKSVFRAVKSPSLGHLKHLGHQYHYTASSGLEFLSGIMIIYIHLILGSIIPCKNQPKLRAFEHCHILIRQTAPSHRGWSPDT